MKQLSYLIFGLALAAASIAVGLYITKFGIGFAKTISDWGAVGDFFGGVLNPTFALLSLILIAYTLVQNQKALAQSEKAIAQGQEAIKQNERALRVSNEELKLTRNELASSSKALEEQAKLIAVQSFETTFFNMLELHSKILNNVYYCPYSNSNTLSKILPHYNEFFPSNKEKGLGSIQAVNRYLGEAYESYKQHDESVDIGIIFDTFYKSENRALASYFRNLYQILKLIKNSRLDKEKQKSYSNILRAQLSNDELSLLLLNCTSKEVDSGQFRGLVIQFELLEHLDCFFNERQNLIAVQNPFFIHKKDILDKYLVVEGGIITQSAFGKNGEIRKFIEHNYERT